MFVIHTTVIGPIAEHYDDFDSAEPDYYDEDEE